MTLKDEHRAVSKRVSWVKRLIDKNVTFRIRFSRTRRVLLIPFHNCLPTCGLQQLINKTVDHNSQVVLLIHDDESNTKLEVTPPL